jgi:hypothetical protein
MIDAPVLRIEPVIDAIVADPAHGEMKTKERKGEPR